MAVARGSEESRASGGEVEVKTNGVATAAPAEPIKAGAGSDPAIGVTLSAARERRGISRAEAAAQSSIPPQYLQMIESSDYELISDQLYLLPFLRRYAAFLGLDGEEIGMRFVRDVQRAEGAMAARMSEPLDLPNVRIEAQWVRIAAIAGIAIVIVGLYLIVAGRHRAEVSPLPPAPSAVPAVSGAILPPAVAAPPAALAAQAIPATVPGTSNAAVRSSASVSQPLHDSASGAAVPARRADKPAPRKGR
jgi:cytoskeleton protein RodZ